MNFLVKQALGGVTKDLEGLTGGDKKEPDPDAERRKQEHQEALAEEEAERKAKHAKFEAQRETVRNQVRSKYGFKSPDQKKQEEEQSNPLVFDFEKNIFFISK